MRFRVNQDETGIGALKRRYRTNANGLQVPETSGTRSQLKTRDRSFYTGRSENNRSNPENSEPHRQK